MREILSNFLGFGRARMANVSSQRVLASLPIQSSGIYAAPEESGP
jgi:hypothetical protein